MSTAAVTPDPYASIAKPIQADPYAAIAKPIAAPDAPEGFWKGLQNYVEHPEQRGAGQPNALNRFGGAMVQMVGNAVQHPLDTIGSAVKSTVLATTPLVGVVSPQTAANNNPVVQTVRDAKQNGMAVAAGHLVGGMAVGTALGEGLGAVAEAAPKVIPAVGKAATVVGDTAQDAGTGLMNKTVGTLKSDFKRGANPARGYLETGNGPSVSMHSIADKSATALEDTGSKLGEIYQKVDATGLKIPVDTVAQEMAKPLQKAIDLETGPGGTGNLSTIQSYIQQFEPAFAKAAQNGGFTPSELFKMKRSIAENTNWSDPAQFNLKSVRQQQTGAISGILSDAIPETKALNQTYQDLIKMTDRAQERANTGSRPLTAHIYKAGMTAVGALAGGMEGNALAGAAAGAILDSVPAKTTIATGLFRGGKALSAFGERLAPADSLPVEEVTPNDLGGNRANYKTSNPQLGPPGPPELQASPNATMRGLPSGYNPQALPSSAAGFVPTPASPPPPLNQATARMRVQPSRPSASTELPSRGTVTVSPSGDAALTAKGLPAPDATTTPKPLAGKALWAQKGTKNLEAHGVSASDLDELAKTAKGKDLLVIASGLTPGSAAMKNVVKQIKALH